MELHYRGAFEAPQYETENSAGFDFRSEHNVYLSPGARSVIPTGCYITNMSNDIHAYIRIAPRSGLAYKYGLDILAGVIDADYPDEIKVIVYNTSNEPIIINAGERIAQGIVTIIDRLPGIKVKVKSRSGGFGSTGV